MSRRAFVIVLDAGGVGAASDAAEYGDAGTNTLGHVAERAGGLDLPVLGALGLGWILPLRGVAPAAAGRPLLGGGPADGMAALVEHGAEARERGALILYTSQDSVLQLAALFSGRGIARTHPGPTNTLALAATRRLVTELDEGLVFVNLVETDEVHGHRKDAEGFHRALQGIDAEVGSWTLGEDDLLVLCADHGCDPDHPLSDHTREHTPLLASFAGHGGRRHDGPLADVGASALAWLTGAEAPDLPGDPFL